MLISTISLLLISAWCCFTAVFKNKLEPHNFVNFEKWALLYSGILFLFFSIIFSYQSNWVIYFSIFFCIASLVSYVAGRQIFIKTIVPIAVLIIILPLYQHIIFWVSLPIRLICTNLTGRSFVYFRYEYNFRLNSDFCGGRESGYNFSMQRDCSS